MPTGRAVRWFALAAAIVLALVVLLPPLIKLKSLRRNIVDSISGALGRQVTVREVRLRLFPQPGFDLEGFVVQDEPAFGAEPMLRAEEVTASLRPGSLWRWRPEISALALKSPAGRQPWSLNVVRRADGHWNLESLLARASQTPAAPTAKSRPEARLRFPYLEGEGGRINFKSGMEKKVYALSEADFALWLASEKEWNLRLRARPVRTDANLSDTGTIEITGALGRAVNMAETPLRLRVSLQNAQLGQLTYLVYGRDRGWRGSVNVAADLIGTPQELRLSAAGSINDFRRYDIIVRDTLTIEGSCTAEYRSQAQELSNLDCRTRNGGMALRGSVRNVVGPRVYDIALIAQQVQMVDVARLARHAKFALPEDLTAVGSLDAEINCCAANDKAWTGGGSTRNVVLRSGVFGDELQLGTVKFRLEAAEKPLTTSKSWGMAHNEPAAATGNGNLRLALAPFAVSLGGVTPAKVQASLSTVGYDVRIEGDAELQRLFRVARGVGLHAPEFPATGSANLNLQIAGNWTGFTAPVSTGLMQLRNLTVLLAGVRGPAHVRTANAHLLRNDVQLDDLAVSFTGSRLAVDGSIVVPRNCPPSQTCPVRFDLHSSQVSSDELNRLLNPQFQRVPWYRALTGERGRRVGTLAANGRIRVDHVTLKGLEVGHVVAQAELQDRKLRLLDIHGDTLGGRIRAEWNADFASDAALYSGSGALERVALSQVAALMHNPWATGTASAQFKLRLAGWSAAELAQSAEGTLDFDWQNGTLPQFALDDTGRPLRLKRFTGRALVHDRRLQFEQSKFESPDGLYSVGGSASVTHLELKLNDPKSRSYAVSGTLEKPHVSALPPSETQAALGK